MDGSVESRRALASALEHLDHIETADIEQIMLTLEVNSTERDVFLGKALHSATNKGLVPMVELLLKHTDWADRVLERTNDYGSTLLMMAAVRNHGDIMSLLLRAGCFVNSVDLESRTALHWTAMAGNLKACQELLDNASWSDHPDAIYSFTPLMLAARQGHTDIVRLLLTHDCDINRRDLHGETPLFDAVRNNNLDCMELLICAGADIDAPDKRARTPIYNGILYGRSQAMRLLIAYNCSVNVRSGGYSPLEVAVMESQEEACDMLVEAGADITCLQHYLTMRTDSNFPSGLSVKEWISQIICEPPKTLKHLTRLAIRRFYETNLPSVVDNLPLPRALRTYIMMTDVTQPLGSSHGGIHQAYIPLYESTPV